MLVDLITAHDHAIAFFETADLERIVVELNDFEELFSHSLQESLVIVGGHGPMDALGLKRHILPVGRSDHDAERVAARLVNLADHSFGDVIGLLDKRRHAAPAADLNEEEKQPR